MGQAGISFHMPGHKQITPRMADLERLAEYGLFACDLSEMAGLDYLHSPTGSLAEAQALAADAFGADFSFFLINGSTAGNHAALLATLREGDRVLVSRASHRSVFAGLLLSDAEPVFVPPQVHPQAGVVLATDIDAFKEVHQQTPETKALHVTSPSYYGFSSNLSGLAQLAHQAEVPLLVDEAHGAHFSFHQDLPPAAIAAGADLVVQSTHKTLGSLYQSSMLHGREGKVTAGEVSQALSMLQSSSPSSLLLASLDAVRSRMATQGNGLLSKAIELAESSRSRIREIAGMWCYGVELVGSGGVDSCDPTKLMVRVSDSGWTGHAAASWLRREHGLEVEFSDAANIVCTVTIADTKEDLDALVEGLRKLSQAARASSTMRPQGVNRWPPIPKRTMSMRRATFARSRSLPLREATGSIAAESVIPYPPGIPILVPGELIDAATVEYLEEVRARGASIVGTKDPSLKSVQTVVI